MGGHSYQNKSELVYSVHLCVLSEQMSFVFPCGITTPQRKRHGNPHRNMSLRNPSFLSPSPQGTPSRLQVCGDGPVLVGEARPHLAIPATAEPTLMRQGPHVGRGAGGTGPGQV